MECHAIQYLLSKSARVQSMQHITITGIHSNVLLRNIESAIRTVLFCFAVSYSRYAQSIARRTNNQFRSSAYNHTASQYTIRPGSCAVQQVIPAPCSPRVVSQYNQSGSQSVNHHLMHFQYSKRISLVCIPMRWNFPSHGTTLIKLQLQFYVNEYIWMNLIRRNEINDHKYKYIESMKTLKLQFTK